jgi:hypothetical protein
VLTSSDRHYVHLAPEFRLDDFKGNNARVINAAKQQAQDLKNSQRVKLTLGVMCTIAPLRLKDLIAGVGALQPQIELEVFDSTAPVLEKRLEQGNTRDRDLLPPRSSEFPLAHAAEFREMRVGAFATQERTTELHLKQFDRARQR